MLPFLCDDPDRIAARFFVAVRGPKERECPCCTFYRAFAIGFVAGSGLASLFWCGAFLFIRHT